ncbi:MAG: hypothetical protein QS748_08240 [Candidatus Endonucleobacter bathymodioli]|uniref:Uncharacterized protein n=1 Tax=Candidatus Endonucleibacter bathymodioli TaxID=539814 RepID=A0AA90ST17_9GAMM|nr:hypothetical protein [Candidatus Endonucleobacter bathymodioli]
MGGYLNRSNKTISLELMRCHRWAYDAEKAYRHSLQKRKTQDARRKTQDATQFHKRTDAVSRQVKSQLGLGFTPEQIAGRMKLESYNGPMGYQTIYRLIKKTNGAAFSRAKVNVIGSAMVLRLEPASFLIAWILMSAWTAWI